MKRISFRPRPLDIYKKIPIVKSLSELEDDDTRTAASIPSSQLHRIVGGSTNQDTNSRKKDSSKIPIPDFVIVDTYTRDYPCTFKQPASYIRASGAREEIGIFVEYDLDEEDENWLLGFNNDKEILTPQRFEILLYMLEVLDYKARERAGILTLTAGSPVPVILQLGSAAKVIQSTAVRYIVFQSVYNYWKKKRDKWQKPILRRFQPPPPANDTNPYNVFRPREKTHRVHTRRFQRRENSVLSFQRLRQVRANLGQAKCVIRSLIKREEKKREVLENEVSLQRIEMKYKKEAQFLESEQVVRPQYFSKKYGPSKNLVDSRELSASHARGRPPLAHNRMGRAPAGRIQSEVKWQRQVPPRVPQEPAMLFTRPLDPEKLEAAAIVPPPDPATDNDSGAPPFHFRGRIGRGGRIIFDRQPSI